MTSQILTEITDKQIMEAIKENFQMTSEHLQGLARVNRNNEVFYSHCKRANNYLEQAHKEIVSLANFLK